MFAERQGSTAIDYLTSTDGIHFKIVTPDVVASRSSGAPYVRAPGQDSETASWLYYGGTTDPNSTQNKIYFQSWSAK